MLAEWLFRRPDDDCTDRLITCFSPPAWHFRPGSVQLYFDPDPMILMQPAQDVKNMEILPAGLPPFRRP